MTTRGDTIADLSLLAEIYRNMRGRKSATSQHRHTLDLIEIYMNQQLTQLLKEAE